MYEGDEHITRELEKLQEEMFKRAFIGSAIMIAFLFCSAVYIDNQNDKLQAEIYQTKRELFKAKQELKTVKKLWLIRN